MTDEEDKKVFDELPDPFTIYRGYRKGQNFEGLSYTLSLDKAKWFAKRYTLKEKGLVRTRTVKKSDVLAYSNQRGEQEIILRPEKLVR